MLEPPPIPPALLLDRLRTEYNLSPTRVTFLPIGADINTAVYRVDVPSGAPYFLKLRGGDFNPITVEVPRLLAERGAASFRAASFRADALRAAIIAPLETRAGGLWGSLHPYKMILYPFVEGQDGYQVTLTERQWIEYGAVLRGLHEIRLPAALAKRIPLENFSPIHRNRTRLYLAQVETARFSDPSAAFSGAKAVQAPPAASKVRGSSPIPLKNDNKPRTSGGPAQFDAPAASSGAKAQLAAPAAQLAALIRQRRDTMLHMLDRCDRLGEVLQARAEASTLEYVLCHADIHPGNLHITPQGHLYLVDWDNILFAPKERDLMSIGAGMSGDTPHSEALFYQGYYHGGDRGNDRVPSQDDAPSENVGDFADTRSDQDGDSSHGIGYTQSAVDRIALAYYRYERIIADFAAYGDQLLGSSEGEEDREQAYEFFASNFHPGGVIEVAFRTDRYVMH